MGSRRTHDDRMAAAPRGRAHRRGAGRLSSPIGLDLGARTPGGDRGLASPPRSSPARWGGTGDRLAATSGRIHQDPHRHADRRDRPTGPDGCSRPVPRQVGRATVTAVTPEQSRSTPWGTMSTDRDLRDRRLEAVRPGPPSSSSATRRATGCAPRSCDSWQLSTGAVTPDLTEAPLADESDTAAYWRQSPLQTAVERVEADLRRTAEDGDLVIAVTDAETRILWTYGGRVMRRKAETVNFVPGGRWDERSVGTNALAIAGRTGDPSMVFSAEHYASIVHNWVCWAAPAARPGDRRAARRHRPVDHVGPHPPDRPGHGAGDGAPHRDRDADRRGVRASPRCAPSRARPHAVAARHGRGLARRPAAAAQPAPDRDPGPARHAPRRASRSSTSTRCVYGDSAVTTSTLKAEVSHLRAALRRTAVVAPLPAHAAGRHRHRRGAAAAASRRRARGRGGVRRRPAAGHQRPGPRRDGGLPGGEHARGADRRTPTPRRCCATASSRRTTRTSSRSASTTSGSATTPPRPCSAAGWPSPSADPDRPLRAGGRRLLDRKCSCVCPFPDPVTSSP